MWVIPERMAADVGPALLERALDEGLAAPRSADLEPRPCVMADLWPGERCQVQVSARSSRADKARIGSRRTSVAAPCVHLLPLRIR